MPKPAHDDDGHRRRLAPREVGGAGDLVGDRDPVDAEHVADPVDACRAGRCSGAIPATPIATSVVPWRNGRPNESRHDHGDIPRRALAQARRGCARALSSGSSGQQHERAGSGVFEWSTPAEAQTKPWRVSAITSGAALAHDPPSRAGPPRARAGRARAGQLARPRRRLDVRRARRRGPRPSRPPSARRRPRRRPRARRARRSARRGRRPRRSRAGRATGRIEITASNAGDADRRRGPCSGGSGSRSPRSGPRACARSRAGRHRAPGRRRASPRARARAPSPSASSPQTSASSSGGASSRFAAAIECRPAVTGAATSSWIRSASRRASGSGRTPPFENWIALATESSGVVAERVRDRRGGRERGVRLDREHRQVGAAHRVLVRRAVDAAAELARPSRAPGRRRASRSRPRPRRRATSRAASARPKLPGAAERLRPSRERARGVEHAPGEPAARLGVAHQRLRDDGAHAVAAARRARRPRRSPARRSGPGSSRRRAPARCRPRAAASIRSAGPFTARPPISGLTATHGTRALLERRADLLDREDRPDRDVRVARRDHDDVGLLERLEHAGRRRGLGRARVVDRVHLVAVRRVRRTRSGTGTSRRASRRTSAAARRSPAAARTRARTRAASRAVASESGAPARRSCVRTRCRPRSRSPSRNHASPPSSPPSRARSTSRPARPQPRSSSATPASA